MSTTIKLAPDESAIVFTPQGDTGAVTATVYAVADPETGEQAYCPVNTALTAALQSLKKGDYQ